MANVRLTMRKIREVLRLHFECDRNQREIADAVGTSTTTVWHYLRRTRLAGLSWPLPPELLTDDAALEARLYPPPARREPTRGMPDWPAVHREIGRKGVTLDLLWQEYKAQHPDGCGYSWFCKAYQEWAQRLPVTMRQTHVPGQKLFVDYSGKKLGIINPDTGEIREAELFVAALGVSGFTFAELTWTQQLPDWIGSHVRAFAFYNGLVSKSPAGDFSGNQQVLVMRRSAAEPAPLLASRRRLLHITRAGLKRI
jgi:transposase